jgi:hypothetical protein
MRSGQEQDRPRRAGRSPGWPTTSVPGVPRWAGCGIPPTSRRATTRHPRGRAGRGRPAVASRAAPGAPRGRAAPGRRDAARVPACKITAGRGAYASDWDRNRSFSVNEARACGRRHHRRDPVAYGCAPDSHCHRGALPPVRRSAASSRRGPVVMYCRSQRAGHSLLFTRPHLLLAK